MKLWLDDLRKPPEGWYWLKTADEAIDCMANCVEMEAVSVISMDHDLSDLQYIQEGQLSKEQREAIAKEKTGYDVICWMEENNCWPARVVIHSMNPEGARRMADVAARHTRTILCPYTGKEI